MVRKDASYTKSTRLQEIKRKISESIEKGVDVEKLLDWVEFNIGLRRETARNYIDLIVRANGWIQDGSIIKAEL